jgi:peroxidase
MPFLYRGIGGSNNNLADPALNTVGTDFGRIGPANFADGYYAMMPGPNPRTVSNVVVAGEGTVLNPEGLSRLMYAWGQFIDHDLDLSVPDGVTHMDVPMPEDEPHFPNDSYIPLTRSTIDPNTGVSGSPALR